MRIKHKYRADGDITVMRKWVSWKGKVATECKIQTLFNSWGMSSALNRRSLVDNLRIFHGDRHGDRMQHVHDTKHG